MSQGSGLDPGQTTVRLAEVRSRKGEIAVTRYHSVPVEAGESPRAAAAAAFGRMRKKPAPVRVGIGGADVMMRYLPVPEVEDWRLERLMDFEVREIESRSGAPLATSFNLLPTPKELDEEDTILLGLIREDLLQGWIDDLGTLPVQGFSPSSIALYNAFLALGDHEPSVTLLANLGAGTLDLALVRGTELYFARSVTTGLDKRDATLAQRLKTDARRAEGLIRKHLDLSAATGARLGIDEERVTRPLLPLYDPVPTLLSGAITLCKAQARLRDLTLDRVLVTGGGAAVRGLCAFLTERLRVPVSVWNPVEMVDASALPDGQYDQLEADGPAATVALGLALSAADPDLYALEILPQAARKKRDFRQRGVFAVAAVVLAVLYLGLEYTTLGARAGDAASEASRLRRQVEAAKSNHGRALDLIDRTTALKDIVDDLSARYAVRRSAEEVAGVLAASLPGNLWVDSMRVELVSGDEWELPGRTLPVVTVSGRGTNSSRRADQAFTDFCEQLKARLPSGERLRYSSRPKGREEAWTFSVHLVEVPEPALEEEA